MRLKDGDAAAGGYTYLCMNHPDYRQWKKRQSVALLKRIASMALRLWNPSGPPTKARSARYGCLCDHCPRAFLRAHPDAKGIPSFTDATSSDYYRTNRLLYEQCWTSVLRVSPPFSMIW